MVKIAYLEVEIAFLRIVSKVLAMLSHNQSHNLLEQNSETRDLAPNILYIVLLTLP
jgi:hypothetical protein